MPFWNKKNEAPSSELEESFIPMENRGDNHEPMNSSSQSPSHFTLKTKIAFGVFVTMAAAAVTAAATLLPGSSKSGATHNGTCPANNMTGNLTLSHGMSTYYYNASTGSGYISPNMTELAKLPCHILLCLSGWAITETVAFFERTQVVINEACSDTSAARIAYACEHYTREENYTIPECDQPPEKRSCKKFGSELVEAEARKKCRLHIFAPDNNEGFILDSENDTINGQPANFSQSGEITTDRWKLEAVK